MKRFLIVCICALMLVFSCIGFAACGDKSGEITFYMPDGAPALAAAKLMTEENDFGKKVRYTVVGANEIESTVTYENDERNADLCILPINSAAKLLGDGTKYKMLGAVTHGNLFIAANSVKEDVTAENFTESLMGKKVGVVNLPAFPGAVFKLILKKYGIENAVLENVAPTAVDGNNSDYDYFVIPEPAASTRTGNPNLNLKIVGSLQSLYGENGYPQAVLMAKTKLIEREPEFIKSIMEAMSENSTWLNEGEFEMQTLISAISSHFADPENTAPSFNANNLNKTVLSNCAVRFEKSDLCSQAAKTILSELKAAGDAKAEEVVDNFFYFLNG